MKSDRRPHVILNVAMTADGKTDTFARRGAALSSASDLERVDRLRAASDAIMVGGRTLFGDDPRLTVKSAALRVERAARGLPENPWKVGIVTRADLVPDSQFLSAGPAPIWIFTTEQTAGSQIERLRELGAEVTVMGRDRVDLEGALDLLKSAGIDHLLVEGGGTLNFELLRLGLVDELSVYVAPLVLGGAGAPTWVDGAGLSRDQALSLKLISVERCEDGGILLLYALPR